MRAHIGEFLLPIICRQYPRVPIYVDTKLFVATVTNDCIKSLGQSSEDPSGVITDVLIRHSFDDCDYMRPHISDEFASAVSELRVIYAQYAARKAAEQERIKQERRARQAAGDDSSSDEEPRPKKRRPVANTIVNESSDSSDEDVVPTRAQAQHDTEEEESDEEEPLRKPSQTSNK